MFSMTTQSRMMIWALVASSWLGACGTVAAGTQPHEKSALDHRAAAEQEAAESGAHAAQYDPQARSVQKRCDPGLGQPPGYPVIRTTPTSAPYPVYPITRVCWTEQANPTASHQKQAEQHRQVAAQHRAASEALRAAEARACAGLSDDDRDMSPFAHRSDIQTVQALRDGVTEYERRLGEGSSEGHLLGATIVFWAVPGLTAQWLQRVVDCHLERNASIGHERASAEMADCPLTERGAWATVRALSSGFAVDVRSDGSDGAQRIWQRAQRLAARQ
jgi:hypothetical protein